MTSTGPRVPFKFVVRPNAVTGYRCRLMSVRPWWPTRRLLKQALQLPDRSGLRPWTYNALLGLLSVTGLRVGEALRLRLDDVDLDACVLTVRGTKFGKSRLVPIHASTRDVLADYQTRRASHLCGRNAACFFVTRTGNPLDGADVRRTFYGLSRQVGLRGQDDSHGPAA